MQFQLLSSRFNGWQASKFGSRTSRFGRTDMFLCSGCSQEFQIVENADVQICPNCSQRPQSNRRVPKLKPDEDAKRIRIDNAHPVYKGEVEAGESSDSHELIQQVATWVSVRSMSHTVVFGLFVFLLGQTLHSWAFVAGNYLVWSLANLISVLGVATALISTAITLRNLDKRIQVLAEAVPRLTNRRRSRERKKQFEKN